MNTINDIHYDHSENDDDMNTNVIHVINIF